MELIEPHRARFVKLIRHGAAAQDIHAGRDEVSGAADAAASDAFVARELERVAMHLRGLVPILQENCFLVDRVLDVGCSTGGTTCAIALSERFRAAEIVGVDPNALSIEAARVRADGLGVSARVAFQAIAAGAPLPFPDGAFDLVLAVSVLEFVPGDQRAAFLAEMERVTRVGGFVYVATPHAFRLKEVHTRRWFGNLRRSVQQPWASPRWAIRHSLRGCSKLPLIAPVAARTARRLGLRSVPWSLRVAASVMGNVGVWKKLLFRRVG